MFKTLLKVFIIIAVFTTISLVIPDGITADMDSAVQYFISNLYVLNSIMHVATFLTCLQIIVNFIFGACIFWFFHFIIKHTG